jgi:hypothetical protein
MLDVSVAKIVRARFCTDLGNGLLVCFCGGELSA